MTFQLPNSLMREGWIPQKKTKTSFCQFLKAFIFSVKCHLHSAWKYKSEDPAHEHNSSQTFRSEYPARHHCKDHWNPAPDISLQWASVNCISWCLRELSFLLIVLINQSQSLAPTSQVFPSWSQWKLPGTYPSKFGGYAAKLVLWKALFCRGNEIWHVQPRLSGEMPFPQNFSCSTEISVFCSAMLKGGSASFKSCSLFLSSDTE